MKLGFTFQAFWLRLCALLMLSLPSISYAEKTAEIVKEGEVRLEKNQQSQEQVDGLHKASRDLAEEYFSKLKVVEGLQIYNQLLAKQLGNQDREIERLRDSIANAAVIERQILPLLLRMVEGLDEFIALDVPFLLQERQKRANSLKTLIEKADVTTAEKARKVFEAYQIETEYGNTIEAYKGKLSLADKTFDVDYLRVGRVAFMYRTVGRDAYGYWNKEQQAWLPLESSQHKLNIDKGLKMARQEMAPELLTLPVLNTEETL